MPCMCTHPLAYKPDSDSDSDGQTRLSWAFGYRWIRHCVNSIFFPQLLLPCYFTSRTARYSSAYSKFNFPETSTKTFRVQMVEKRRNVPTKDSETRSACTQCRSEWRLLFHYSVSSFQSHIYTRCSVFFQKDVIFFFLRKHECIKNKCKLDFLFVLQSRHLFCYSQCYFKCNKVRRTIQSNSQT